MSLETIRLTLVPCVPAHLLALIEGPARFETVSGLRSADGLGEFYRSEHVRPEWLAALHSAEAADPWRFGFFVIHRESGAVIGAGGFTGPPDDSATVEIGYGIVPSFEGQGYATEVAAALVEFAFTSGQVHVVRAHTLPEANPSTGVLVKCGFRHIGTIVDPVDGPVWRWERSPDSRAPMKALG